MNSHSKIIIYDDSCPLCAAYTNAFIQTGFIKKENRKNFSNIEPEWIAMVDLKRSANEIPVIDATTHQVWYGIDALLQILGQKIPFIKTAGNIQPIKWLLYKLYRLISYNRRVIVAGKQTPGSYDCTPDFTLRYRLLFIVACLCFTTWMLFPIQHYLLRTATTNHAISQLMHTHFGLVTSNIIIASKLGKMKGIEYLGQLTMLALIGVLLTIPAILANKYLHIQNASFDSFYLGMLAIVLINEYRRRMKFADIIPHNAWVVFVHIVSTTVLIAYLLS